jgi:hypothetical protein
MPHLPTSCLINYIPYITHISFPTSTLHPHYSPRNNTILIILTRDVTTALCPLLCTLNDFSREFIDCPNQYILTLHPYYLPLVDLLPYPTTPTNSKKHYTYNPKYMLTSIPHHHKSLHSTLNLHTYTLHACPLPTLLPPRINQSPPPPHPHYQTPQLSITTNHHIQRTLLLLLCGDIHPNPGPMPNLLHPHPPAHKKRQTTYFLPSSIKFHPEYQHIANTFKPFFQHTHHLHAQTILSLPYLYNHIQQHDNHPPPHGSYTP